MDKLKFLADTMLGSLAKKLRLLGIDTAYFNVIDDSALKYIVRSESRILLTRNFTLSKELSDLAWSVTGNDARKEFLSIAECLSTAGCQPDPFSICLDCNETLLSIDPSMADGKVPPYIYQSKTTFSRCPSCEKVFWEGTHRKKMEKEVEWMKEQIKGYSNCLG